jgi:hypothetical protein
MLRFGIEPGLAKKQVSGILSFGKIEKNNRICATARFRFTGSEIS